MMGSGSMGNQYEEIHRQSIEQPELFWGKAVKRVPETVAESTKGMRMRGLCCSLVVIYKKITGGKFLRLRTLKTKWC